MARLTAENFCEFQSPGSRKGQCARPWEDAAGVVGAWGRSPRHSNTLWAHKVEASEVLQPAGLFTSMLHRPRVGAG